MSLAIRNAGGQSAARYVLGGVSWRRKADVVLPFLSGVINLLRGSTLMAGSSLLAGGVFNRLFSQSTSLRSNIQLQYYVKAQAKFVYRRICTDCEELSWFDLHLSRFDDRESKIQKRDITV